MISLPNGSIRHRAIPAIMAAAIAVLTASAAEADTFGTALSGPTSGVLWD